jgi:sec-independent protein translocase protein TatA
MFAEMFSPTEIGIVLIVVLVLFGGSQLPKLAKNIGKAQKEFKEGLAEGSKTSEAAKSESTKTDGDA